MKKCVMCSSDIPDSAKLCPHCNSNQSNWVRKMRKFVATFSGLSVVLGVITISVSLFPDAIKVLFYKESVDIHDLRLGLETSSIQMNIINKGDGDVFLNSIQFLPEDESKYPIRGKRLIVNEWIKEGEVYKIFRPGKRIEPFYCDRGRSLDYKFLN